MKIKLPSSVFESGYLEDVGLLNKAAVTAGKIITNFTGLQSNNDYANYIEFLSLRTGPRPDLDPDVIAALDEDFDHEDPENLLEDDFIQLANEGLNEILDEEPTAEDLEGLFSDEESEQGKLKLNNATEDESDSEGSNYDDEELDSVGSMDGPQFSFCDEETKTQFTNYSMTSSVVRRNKQLLLVDDRFEKFFENYEDTEIGALDCDEIEGDINPESDLLLKYAEEFEKEKQQEEDLNSKIVNMAVNDESMSEADSEDSEDDKPKEKWDCQSIISTYSTTKNRPKIIREPSKVKQSFYADKYYETLLLIFDAIGCNFLIVRKII